MPTTFRHSDTSYVINPRMEILGVLIGGAKRHGKEHYFPCGETILKQYHWHTARELCVRALWNHLGALERDGYINRIRRHVRGPDGNLELHSTCYQLKRRAWGWLRKIQGITSRAGQKPAQVIDSSAVQETAQYLRPTLDHLPALPRKEPPAEWKNMLDRLRRGKV